ncbi:hypothetical protein HALLA_14555 [Halostagnicola larsenii XH-48]|uniref:Uncharacterized protein n=2 Tax=Halostagnicola larsenii TaxID=353800 RepID=W0JR22_9EURY|nr:hypothetical protein HALLA_14555 [Halostagnicola larsenii XH-48]
MVFALVGSLMFMGFAGTAAAQNDTNESANNIGVGVGGDGGDGGDATHEGHNVDVETGPAIVDQEQDASNSNTQAASSSSPADNPDHNKYDDGGDAGPSQFQNVNQQNAQEQTGYADSSAEVGDVSGDANAGDGGDGGDADVEAEQEFEEETTVEDGGADDGGADDGGDDGTTDLTGIQDSLDEIIELLELDIEV